MLEQFHDNNYIAYSMFFLNKINTIMKTNNPISKARLRHVIRKVHLLNLSKKKQVARDLYFLKFYININRYQ